MRNLLLHFGVSVAVSLAVMALLQSISAVAIIGGFIVVAAELSHGFLPKYTFQWRDFAANCGGVLYTVLLLLLIV